jgi:anti-anti-sigma factor
MIKAACASACPLENGNLAITVAEPQIREAQTAYGLRDEMNALIDQHKPGNIVLDLANVNYIGSIGFLAFLSVRRKLGGGRIVLCNVSSPVRDMFAVCRLIPTESAATAPFEIASSLEESVSRLSQ